MTSELNDKINTSALWNFPEIVSADEMLIKTPCEFGIEGAPSVEMSELDKKLLEIEMIKENLKQKEQLLDQQLLFMNQLGHAMQRQSRVMDEELIAILESIIKKIIYKTIYMNIETNSSLLKSVIFTLKEKMGNNTDLTLRLSREDSERIGNSLDGFKLIVDENLSVGDICIDSSNSQLNHILLDRIDELMKDQHHDE